MIIRLFQGLPYVSVTVQYKGLKQTLDNVLLDTGSAGTIFSADKMGEIGIHVEPGDDIYVIRGVGGKEYVFGKWVEALICGDHQIGPFEIEVGAMEYGNSMDGILGMDVLGRLSANIDFSDLKVTFPRPA